MTEQEYERIVNSTLSRIRELLVVKSKEYRRNSDPFHVFMVGARRTGLIPEKVLDGMLLKHEISIADMTDDLEKGIVPSKEVIEEKFNDNIIYLLLKKAMMLERAEF